MFSKDEKSFMEGLGAGILVALFACVMVIKVTDAKLEKIPTDINCTVEVREPLLYCMTPFNEMAVFEYEVLPREPLMEERDLDNILTGENWIFNLVNCSNTKYKEVK